MLIQLSGKFTIDPVQYPRRLVVELDVGEDHPECGVISGMHDGFEEPEEMNQRLDSFPAEEDTPWLRRYDILAPNRSQPSRRNGYHYVAIGWYNGVYAAYPIPTEVTLEDSAGSWSVVIGRTDGGVTVLLHDYSPWNEYICADCGHEQDSDRGCDECHSPRVVLISFIERVVGANWRDSFPMDQYPKAWEQPGWDS